MSSHKRGGEESPDGNTAELHSARDSAPIQGVQRGGARASRRVNLSAAANIVAQARAKAASEGNVVDLTKERLRQTRVESGRDPDTEQEYLRIRFPQRGRDDLVIPASSLLRVPRVAEPLAEGFRLWGISKAVSYRFEAMGRLSQGLITYLSENLPGATLADLTRPLLTAYKKWLDSPRWSTETKLLHPTRRMKLLDTPRLLLNELVRHEHWGHDARAALEDYPINAYPGAATKSTPRARLPREVLEAIDQAAQTEVAAIQRRLDEGRQLLTEGLERLAAGDRDYSHPGTALAEMATRYPNVFPSYEGLRFEAPELYAWVYTGNRKGRSHGIARLGSYLYASSRDLVPFILLFAIEGAFNPDTVLALDWSGISVVDRLGEKSIRVTGPKARAHADPVKYLDAAWVGPWLDALRELTSRLRPLLPPADQGCVFTFAQAAGEARNAAVFRNRGGWSGNGCWKRGLAAFSKDHGLPAFNLSQIRATVGDEIGQRHDSLIAMQALNHRSFSTTETSYLGSGTRGRESEHLGSTVQQMERWVQTEGRVDTRNTRLTPSMDKGAATPGYGCADPYDSPRPGQKKNHLCAAYGECPTCPLAHADLDDPVAVALYLALRGAIYRGQERMAPQTWLDRWAPVLLSLQSQLGQVAPQVLANAAKYRVHLPSVG